MFVSVGGGHAFCVGGTRDVAVCRDRGVAGVRRLSRAAVVRLAATGDDEKEEQDPTLMAPPSLKAKPQVNAVQAQAQTNRSSSREEGEQEQEEKLVEAFSASTRIAAQSPSELVRPRDPSELRTVSERRRNSPVKSVRRIRKQRRLKSDELDWDALDSQPLVRRPVDPTTGEDYYVEIDVAKSRDSGKEKKRRARAVDANMREKLKRETVSPYKNNWIGVVVVVVLVLIALYQILPTQAPIIRIPDL